MTAKPTCACRYRRSLIRSAAQHERSQAHNTWTSTPPGEPVEAFLQAAQALVPKLIETVERPEWLVNSVADPEHPLRVHMTCVVRADLLADKVLHAVDQFTLDFGGHRAVLPVVSPRSQWPRA